MPESGYAYQVRWEHGPDDLPNFVAGVTSFYEEYPFDTKEAAAEAGCDLYDQGGVDHRVRVPIWYDEGNQQWSVTCEAWTGSGWVQSGGFALFEGDPCRQAGWIDVAPCCLPGYTYDANNGQCRKYDCPFFANLFGQCQIEPSERCTGNPIDPGPGVKLQREVDYVGSGTPLTFTRSYNNQLNFQSTGNGLQPPLKNEWVPRYTDFETWQLNVPAGYAPEASVLTAPSQFGDVHWRSNFDASITAFSDPHTDGVSVLRPTGRDHHTYTHAGNDLFYAVTDTGATLQWLPGAPGGVQWRYIAGGEHIEEFDTNGKLLTIQSRQGHIQTLSYDAQGRLDRVDTNQGESLVFTYDASDRLDTVTDHANRTWTYRYDAKDNLEFVDNPDGTTRQYHYEDANFPHALTGITDENLNRYATYGYDSQGRTILSTHAGNAQRVDIVYNADGTRSMTNSRGEASTYHTQQQGGETLITQVSGPGCSTCGEGDSTYQYDPVTNDLVSKTEIGITTTYGNYDANGNPGFQIEAAGTPEQRRTDFTYDSRYQNKIATRTEPSVHAGSQKITTYGYDDFGNRTSETITGFTPSGTPVSRTTTWQYNGPLNQLSQIDGPRTNVADITTFDYYPNDPAEGVNRARLQRVTGPTGILERDNIQYTATGKVASESRPNGLNLTYSYYAGNDRLETLTETTGVGSRVTRWTYLATGEVETITTAHGTSDATVLIFGYDDARRLTRITDGAGNYIEYVLDTEGNRLAENTRDAGNVLKKQLTQTFDIYNRLDTSS